MLLVSRCLTGAPCRYNGKGKPNRAVIEFLRGLACGRDYLLICPESAGGLAIPRPPCEIEGGRAADVLEGRARVLSQTGEDHTKEFLRGAEQACALAARHKARAALLKENSPSCGVRFVHDGSFSKGLLAGRGVTALALAEMGVRLFSEDELDELKSFLTERGEL